MTLRNRLIAVFLASTLLPLAATAWITTSLLDRSLGYATTGDLDRLSRTLEKTAKQFYQRERDSLKNDALAGRTAPATYDARHAGTWPEPLRSFWDSGEPERFGVTGPNGERIEYMRRTEAPDAPGIQVYSRDLGGVSMQQLSSQVRDTRSLVEAIDARDLRRGFTLTLLVLLGAIWVISLVPLILIANRVSRPIQQLTAALTEFAGGDWSRRLHADGHPLGAARDEVGRAIDAFNHMADQLDENRERLVHLTRMASWQSLARKTAHELKNSLTPIRLTVEEMQARQPAGERAFMDQAVQIVVSEIESLERRVRAFSEFASEPPVHPEPLDINALVNERVALLRPAYPGVTYHVRLDDDRPHAHAAPDLVSGILTNLLQNAAEAVRPGGNVLVTTRREGDRVSIDIHDSGPGLSADVTARLFEPTISFKKNGMGLGLSIAKKNALLSGGDVTVLPGKLGGAGFRVTLPS